MIQPALTLGLYLLQIARENEMTLLSAAIVLVGVVSLGLYLTRNWKG